MRHRARVWQQLVPGGGRPVGVLRHAGHLPQPHHLPLPLQKPDGEPRCLQSFTDRCLDAMHDKAMCTFVIVPSAMPL